MSVFVDTSALYALLVSTEESHPEIVSTFRELAESGRRMLTTNYVLIETFALLQHRIGLEAVRDLEFRVVPLLEIRWVDGAIHRRAIQRLFRTDRRKLSLVDCCSFSVMDAEGISEALSLDSDFEREGYLIQPSD
jgi:predicted nucleic acid-binding protein